MKVPDKIANEVRDSVVANLTEYKKAIEAGLPAPWNPWFRPWKDDGTTNTLQPVMAMNGVSKRPYNGCNWFLLNLLVSYESPDYYTLNQIKKLTGSDMPLSKEVFLEGRDIIFWKPIKINDKESGKEKMMPFAKTYKVWNREQIEDCGHELPMVEFPMGDDFDPKTEIDKYLANLNLKGGVHRGGDMAFYRPMDDTIGLPNDSAFTCEHERESTKAHEGVHATGAKHRLDRKRGSRYGDAAYAYEELVAELGAAMTCQYVGIPLEKLQHTQYLQTWLKNLKDDVSFLFSAAAEASKGFQMLAGLDQSVSK